MEKHVCFVLPAKMDLEKQHHVLLRLIVFVPKIYVRARMVLLQLVLFVLFTLPMSVFLVPLDITKMVIYVLNVGSLAGLDL
tara:strand:- start:995 stop:1237 length:243 start_codon:yes stop_codon:yes gene_type:complete